MSKAHWKKGNPLAIGEYNVSNSGDATLRRWWDGKVWSVVYADTTKRRVKLLRRLLPGRPYNVSWRELGTTGRAA